MSKEISLTQFKTHLNEGALDIVYADESNNEYECSISVEDMSLIFNPDFTDRNYVLELEWDDEMPENWEEVNNFIDYNLSELKELAKK